MYTVIIWYKVNGIKFKRKLINIPADSLTDATKKAREFYPSYYEITGLAPEYQDDIISIDDYLAEENQR